MFNGFCCNALIFWALFVFRIAICYFAPLLDNEVVTCITLFFKWYVKKTLYLFIFWVVGFVVVVDCDIVFAHNIELGFDKVICNILFLGVPRRKNSLRSDHFSQRKIHILFLFAGEDVVCLLR